MFLFSEKFYKERKGINLIKLIEISLEKACLKCFKSLLVANISIKLKIAGNQEGKIDWQVREIYHSKIVKKI